VQYLFLCASGAPNSRAAPGRPHSSYATGWVHQCPPWRLDWFKFRLCCHYWNTYRNKKLQLSNQV